MPTYEYRCEQCGTFDFVQKISEEALKVCPTCGEPVKRLLSAAPFHLKGSGWYKTDYSSSSSSSSNGSSAKPPSHTETKESASPAGSPSASGGGDKSGSETPTKSSSGGAESSSQTR